MSQKKLWGGRFKKKINSHFERFSRSIDYDMKLAKYDLIGSLIQIDVLKKANILTVKEHVSLKKGLKGLLKKVNSNSLSFDMTSEDIHGFIQSALEKVCGNAALKLHTARSRNDQVILDTKMYCQDQIDLTVNQLKKLNKAISQLALANKNLVWPGYTHLQHAQPIYFSDYIQAFQEMFKKDIERLSDAKKRCVLNFGSGALAGNFISSKHYKVSIVVDGTKYVIQPTSSSVLVASDRDFILEIVSVLSVIGTHFSRLAEDFILWSTSEFNFVDIDESYCTGSSLMPQKKNPDALELIRGSASRLIGNYTALASLMKGLPLTYNRDMQLDKEPLFNSFELVQDITIILAGLLKSVKIKKSFVAKQLEDEAFYATDLAEYLVKNQVPFKVAHQVVGKLVSYSISKNRSISAMSDGELVRFHKYFNNKVICNIINPVKSVRSKKSIKRS